MGREGTHTMMEDGKGEMGKVVWDHGVQGKGEGGWEG